MHEDACMGKGEEVLGSVQVGFGDVWKQSLSELSGGQRSLLALSLILAMLLFKPAPIYILDEVSTTCQCLPGISVFSLHLFVAMEHTSECQLPSQHSHAWHSSS